MALPRRYKPVDKSVLKTRELRIRRLDPAWMAQLSCDGAASGATGFARPGSSGRRPRDRSRARRHAQYGKRFVGRLGDCTRLGGAEPRRRYEDEEKNRGQSGKADAHPLASAKAKRRRRRRACILCFDLASRL